MEIRPDTTPAPPTGLVATRGDGEVTLSWATPTDETGDVLDEYDYDYRQRRQPGSYGRWTDFAGNEFQRPGTGNAVTSNTVTGLTNGGTYAFQVRGRGHRGGCMRNGVTVRVRIANAESGPSDEVSVSLSGTVETGALSAPRNFAAAAGDRQVTLSWTAPAADGGAAISGYQYQLRAGAGASGQWTTIPGGGPSTRPYIVTGLTNGTRYFFQGPGREQRWRGPTVGRGVRHAGAHRRHDPPRVELVDGYAGAGAGYADAGLHAGYPHLHGRPRQQRDAGGGDGDAEQGGREGDDHAGRREHHRGPVTRWPWWSGPTPSGVTRGRRHEHRRLYHHGDAGR